MMEQKSSKPSSQLEQHFQAQNTNSKKIPRSILTATNFGDILLRNKKTRRLGVFQEKDRIMPHYETEDMGEVLKNLARYPTIHNCKHIKTINMELTYIDGEHMQVLANQLSRKFAGLEGLTLSFDNGRILEDDELIVLFNEISRNLANLRSLDLCLKACFLITDRGVISIISEISKRFTQLQQLDLDLSYTDLTDEAIKFITFSLGKRALNLKRLSLIFHAFEKLTDKGLIVAGANLALYLTRLEGLSFELRGSKLVSDKGMNILLTGIGRLINLKQLKFCIESCGLISDKIFKTFGSKILANLPNLLDLTVQLDCDPLTGKGIQTLAKDIGKYLRNLQRLGFLFDNLNDMEDKTVKVIASDMISHLVKLKQLTISFRSGAMSDKGLESLMISITKNLVDLQSLDLDFWGCTSVTGKTLNALGNGAENLSKLQDLAMTLSMNKFTGKEIAAFINIIAKNSPNLKKLKLDLIKMNSMVLDALGTQISAGHFTRLKELILNFRDSTQINDEGVKTFMLAFGQNSIGLERLDLILKGASLTDGSLKALASGASNLCSTLKSLTLDFEKCKKITDEGIIHLGKTLKQYLTELQTINIGYTIYQDDEGDARKILLEEFKTVPYAIV